MTQAKSILLLASESGDGQFRRLLDPALKTALVNSGVLCCEAFVPDITPEDLAWFDVVVVMRSPLPGHPKDDSDVWRKLLPHLAAFVKNGGGLVIMFAESYGKTVGSLNELGSLFDIKFCFNQLLESNPARVGQLRNLSDGKMITCDFTLECPFAPMGGVIDLIVDGGHGTQHLTCLAGPAWQPCLRGSGTCVSQPYPQGVYANNGENEIVAPLLAACRQFGQGRVAAFPGASPFWLANACLLRWGTQLLDQHNGAGFNFLLDMLTWAGENSRGGNCDAAAAKFSGQPLLKQHDYSYRYLKEAEWRELKRLKPYRAWLGTVSDFASLPETAAALWERGYDIGIFIFDYAALTDDKWRELNHQCDALSVSGRFLALPAFEQADAEGNYCVVFNVDKLPEMRDSYPNSNMLEDLLVKLNSYSAVFARPQNCRIPAWRHGGYNLLETDSAEDFALYRDRVSSCAFLSAVYIDRGNSLDTEKFDNWLMARSLEAAPGAIRENCHLNFVSSGPKIKRFFWKSGRVVLDDWEGFWLEWEEGDNAEVEIGLSAAENITEVKLWDGEKVVKTWRPDSVAFNTVAELELDHDLRLHLTASDAGGGELAASWPLYSRNRYFWSHVGSDQMNDYHNVWIPDPNGSIGVGDRIYETCGFVTLGFGWGDYLRIAPPIRWSDIMPQGVEVSSMAGNLQSFHPSVFLARKNGFEFLNNQRRKLGKCTQALHIVHSTADGSWLEQTGAVWRENINPTRNFVISDLLRVETDYFILHWQAGRKCEVTVNMQIKWLNAYKFESGSTISLGHSLHFLKDEIGFCCDEQFINADDFLMADIESLNIPHKEWDNGGLVELLGTAFARGLEISLDQNAGTMGDLMGDFLFKPLRAPGKIFMRGWKHHPGFVLSFELEPDSKDIRPGAVMDIQYILAVTSGAFTPNKGI